MSDKELTDLEIAVAIARLRGDNVITHKESAVLIKDVVLTMNGKKYHELGEEGRKYYNNRNKFNPITDNALNLELRDEYEVTVDYVNQEVFIKEKFVALLCHGLPEPGFRVSFTDKSQINRAVCECILESVK